LFPLKLTIRQIIELLKSQGLWVDDSFGSMTKKADYSDSFQIQDVSIDSRHVTSGNCFIAISGETFDASAYIHEAVARGASIVVTEKKPQIDCFFIMVSSARRAWSVIESARFGNPQDQLKLIGVTGTNGKSSTVWMLCHLLELMGKKTLMLGTLGSKLGSKHLPSQHTTPDPNVLYRLLREAADANATFVAMEVSSHALSQEKVSPLRFDAAVFTSFSRDHLDFHKTMDDYFETKMRLFRQVKHKGLQLVHKDIENKLLQWANLKSAATDHFTFYGLERNPFPELTLEGGRFIGAADTQSQSPYIGALANTNLLASLIVVQFLLGERFKPILPLISLLPQVPGRFEWVGKTDGLADVFVDYAHTPDALFKATETLIRSFPDRKLVLVFGCGGDRDRGKRPLMAEEASRHACRVFVTSDNPRSEDPVQILEDICEGFPKGFHFEKIVDRESAIAKAIQTLCVSEILLIAGKGHETYQIIGAQKIPFDDRLIASKYLHI